MKKNHKDVNLNDKKWQTSKKVTNWLLKYVTNYWKKVTKSEKLVKKCQKLVGKKWKSSEKKGQTCKKSDKK